MSSDVRDAIVEAYLLCMLSRDLYHPFETFEEACLQFGVDAAIITQIYETRYLNGRDHRVPKAGNLHLAWEYAQDPKDHPRFLNMLRLSPQSFQLLLSMIEQHPIFQSGSQNAQAPVETQLAVTLYRMGRYGNGASVQEVARVAGISEGSVENYTDRCLTAIESLHDIFVRPITAAEKEVEKKWIDEHLGFKSTWREGWVMYDGTIVVLYRCPGLQGETYYTRKGNYGLNVQIGNVPSNLRIVDYSHGMTGAVHDAEAFKHTAASVHPDWFFQGDEFAWVDSAYPCSIRTMPVHKEPASRIRENAIYDRYVSHLRVRSEHTMGALKGRFQCLRGLRVHINTQKDHVDALRWITCSIILHNMLIDIEGSASTQQFLDIHTRLEEQEDRGLDAHHVLLHVESGEEKRQILIAELMRYRELRDNV